MKETSFHRQLDVLNPDQAKKKITIIGTGAIGSVTALCLGKIGCSNLKLYDFDKVETHNLPSQFFKPDQVGHSKVGAIAHTIENFTEVKAEVKDKKWDKEISPVMIVAVDSMKERTNIFNELKNKYMVELMIEARMGAEKGRLYPLKPSDPDAQKFYEKTLYKDEQASQERCTNKAIAYNTFIIGGLIASIVKKHFKSEKMPKELIFNLEDYLLWKCD